MVNKEKILLLAMVSMLLPGAFPDVASAELLRQLSERQTEPCPGDAVLLDADASGEEDDNELR